ncbi:MAG: 5-formyltetrahydrofolate cyclo-ligase [Flavobacteriales bacterium]|jgi:5-formyltetrahydrofolate cyclo-ligase
MGAVKKNLRKKYKDLRASLTDEERDQYSLEIANTALSLDIWDHNYYHIFLPINRLKEVNTEYLLSILSGKDKHVLVPKTDFESGTMKNYLLLDNTKITVSSYGIPEPDDDAIEIAFAKADVVFVPLLAYDTLGNRVGYGKGFYDKMLALCRPDVITIGLSFFGPEEIHIPTNPLDISMKYCVSPKEVHAF